MQDKLNKVIIELINIGKFKYEWSFHTITFNITEDYTRDSLKKAGSSYIRWLNNVFKGNELCYIYSFEISQRFHIHMHLILNKTVTNGAKEDLIKDWNELNGWPWYNKKSLYIKNDYEYEESKSVIADEQFFKFKIELKKIDSFIKDKVYENAYIIFKYILKDCLIYDKVLNIYYMIYPNKIIGGSLLYGFSNYIEELNNFYFATLFEKHNISNPFMDKEFMRNNVTLEYLYNNWKTKFELDNKDLVLYFQQIKNEKELKKKQDLLESYILKKQDKLSEIKLFCMNKEHISLLWNLIYIKLIEKLKNQGNLILCFEKLENSIYYILETLVKVVRYYKKEYNDIFSNNKDLLVAFCYTEAYFKAIIRDLYVFNILDKNLYENQKLYKLKNEDILINLENLSKYNKSIYMDLLKLYEKNDLKKEDIKIFYRKNEREIEGLIGLWSNVILEILYDPSVNIIEKIDKISEYNIENNKKQKFFKLTDDFLHYLIMEEYIYDIIPPMVVKPKKFEYMENNYKGGFYKLSNILFSKNENLEYHMSQKLLDIINLNQEQAMYINKKYLNYLLFSKISKIEELTGLGLTNYSENYLDSKIQDIKKVPDIFLIYEFFLAIYMAKQFQDDDNIWFVSKLDERGRKYDVGYPLCFQRDKILRNLFFLDKFKVLNYINETFLKRSENYVIFKAYLENIENEKEYNKFNILQNPIECLVGFDATNQIFQILGGLLIDKNLLQLSNVINLNNNYSNHDIYSYFLKILQIELIKNNDFKIYIIEINKIIDANKGALKMYLTIDTFLLKLDREWIKNVLMTYGYNKSLVGLIEFTYNYLFVDTTYIKISKILCKKIAAYIINLLINKFNNEFKTLKNLKLIFNSLISISKNISHPVYISIDNENGFHQYYIKVEYITFRKWRSFIIGGKKQWKQIRVTYPKIYFGDDNEKKEIDFKKGMNALLPNTCHYLDALLMYIILKELIDLGIPIKTLHDSFYTNIRYKNDIYNTYLNKYIELFEQDILKILLKNTFIEFFFNKDWESLLKKFNININNVTDLFELNFSAKYIKGLNLQSMEKQLYKILLKIIKNFKIIRKENKLEKTFKEYILEYKHSNIVK